MAKPIEATWGPLKLTKTLIDPADSSLSSTDKEELFKLTTIDCFPPPKATTEYKKPIKIIPLVNSGTLQQNDKTNLKNIKNLFGNKPSTLAGVQTAIESRLGLSAMLISYSSKQYKALQKLFPCFTNDIYLRVRYAVFEIKVSANQALTLSTDQFPAGDEIATYRIREVKDYRFESHLTWNNKCCERQPAETPTPPPSDYFLALSESMIDEVIVTGKRIKNAEPLKPIQPEKEDWKFGLGLEYELDEWGLDLDWKKYLKEDD